MNSKLILGAGLGLVGIVMGCGSSSGTGGSGGAGVTVGATTAVTSTHAVTGAVTNTTGTSTTKAATSGAGGGGVQCNPVVDTQCDVAGGAACDFSQDGFTCYTDPPNTAALCAACDTQNGPACKDGSTCLFADDQGNTSKCAKYCCTDADCGGAAGSCVLDGDTIGFCGADGVVPGTSSTGSTSGAGGGGQAFFVPQCTGIPASPPSGGTCGAPT